MLLTAIKEDRTKWRYSPCSQIGELKMKMSVFPNLISGFSSIIIKILSNFLIEIDKLSYGFIHVEFKKQDEHRGREGRIR